MKTGRKAVAVEGPSTQLYEISGQHQVVESIIGYVLNLDRLCGKDNPPIKYDQMDNGE